MSVEDCFYVGVVCAETFDDERASVEPFPVRSTTWTPIVTDQGNPGYQIERNGMIRYILLNLSSNEPTAWVYFGSGTDIGEGDCQPLHFYDLREDFE